MDIFQSLLGPLKQKPDLSLIGELLLWLALMTNLHLSPQAHIQLLLFTLAVKIFDS